MKTALVTGSAGFIGFHAAKRWLDEGWNVVGIDDFNDYYDPDLKEARNSILEGYEGFTCVREEIQTPNVLMDVMAEHRPAHIVHLAAQAGVRYSIENPRAYFDSNLTGTFELLEAARAHPPEKLLLASTSSVYGANPDLPYSETDKADHPVSFYAATKKSTEAMAHSYAHLYDLPTIMFRFFTVYGPWGRPDMALFKFVKAMLADEPIDIYNHGKMQRDFTYVDDLIEAIWRLGRIRQATPGAEDTIKSFDTLSPAAPFRVVNIGKSNSDPLIDFVNEIEKALGVEAKKNFLDLQDGDMLATASDTSQLKALTGYQCETMIWDGIPKFVSWYRQFYNV